MTRLTPLHGSILMEKMLPDSQVILPMRAIFYQIDQILTSGKTSFQIELYWYGMHCRLN